MIVAASFFWRAAGVSASVVFTIPIVSPVGPARGARVGVFASAMITTIFVPVITVPIIIAVPVVPLFNPFSIVPPAFVI